MGFGYHNYHITKRQDRKEKKEKKLCSIRKSMKTGMKDWEKIRGKNYKITCQRGRENVQL